MTKNKLQSNHPGSLTYLGGEQDAFDPISDTPSIHRGFRTCLRALTVAISSLLLCLAVNEPAQGQEPSLKDVLEQKQEGEADEEKPAEAETPQGPQDEFNRGTPRSSFQGYSAAVQEADYERAVEYLDLRNLPDEVAEISAPDLARRLKRVVDRALWIDIDTLSRDPRGILDDGLPSYRDSLGRIELDSHTIDLFMQRVPRGDGNVFIWKISNATVGEVPRLYEIYGYGAIGERLSSVLPDFEILGLQTWQWVMLIGLLVVSYLIAFVPTWIVARMLRLAGTPLSHEFSGFVSGPLRYLTAVLLARTWIDVMRPGVTARAWMEGSTLMIVLLIWVLLRLVDVFFQQWTDRLEAKGHGQATVYIRPAGRILKLLIILFGFVVWLENLGFSATTLIAGLGIGGLAVALAAQKSIENLIGAITLLGSAPVSVGDFCRFGERIGSVEEIGLRATKIRTLERTLVHVPNAIFADMQLENFTARDKTRYKPTIRLRYDTSADQVRYLLVEIRKLLYSHPKVAEKPGRVRFAGYGDNSLHIEISSYVETTDWNEYLAVAEDLNLRIMDIVERAGTALAYPMQTVSVERGRRPKEDAARAAEKQVDAWRERGELYLPDFPEDKIQELRGTLRFPPEGSAGRSSK